MFAGVGGLSLGLKQAGFDVIAAIEKDPVNCVTYKTNFPATRVFESALENVDITEVSPGKPVDVVIGGPPCQGFSHIGKRDVNDPRNTLIFDYLVAASKLDPKYIVMENVPGIMQGSAKSLMDRWVDQAQGLGYEVVTPIQVLTASEFGVPQKRKRTFVFAYRFDCDKPSYPQPVTLNGNTPTVRDAIGDLPIIENYEQLLSSDSAVVQFGPRTDYANSLLHECDCKMGMSAHRIRKVRVVTASKRTTHTQAIVDRFAKVEPGKTDPVSRFARLNMDSQAPTIRAGTGPDHGSHTAARPIHPEQPRCITVREAARLHSFPDWFVFNPTVWHGFKQVGNSVPPKMAEAVSNSLIRWLRD